MFVDVSAYQTKPDGTGNESWRSSLQRRAPAAMWLMFEVVDATSGPVEGSDYLFHLALWQRRMTP